MGEFLFYFSGLLIIFSLYRILIKKELPKKRKIKKNKSSNTDMKPSERYLKSSKTSLKPIQRIIKKEFDLSVNEIKSLEGFNINYYGFDDLNGEKKKYTDYITHKKKYISECLENPKYGFKPPENDIIWSFFNMELLKTDNDIETQDNIKEFMEFFKSEEKFEKSMKILNALRDDEWMLKKELKEIIQIEKKEKEKKELKDKKTLSDLS